ncbi:Starch-binding associating with outer membrane [Flavobacterium micromati]|uniref:Starch-binding associating with outer membrane n=1 Tax=Flavobacterium micromati TaxID=229205 RepID=A0A1M5K1L2_9FLAO|nr:SusD/RagB family nutrient-binding outer membrane lipoprotein [Flavobacterium micromati]SHG46213.1 Starch-binding associating with outer membrane [Flavobacterium micromati]
MKKIKIYDGIINTKNLFVGVFASILLLSSCTSELDINTDPNAPTAVPNSTLLTSSEVNLGYIIGGEATRMPSNIVQYYAGHRGQPNEYARYDITPSSTDGLWTNMYNVLIDLKTIENNTTATNDRLYTGISQLLQVYTFSVLTDTFGDIPYSDALQLSSILTPAYDKQEDIYNNLLARVDLGIANVTTNAGSNPGTADVVYGGSATKWAAFGNSLKLRLLNHLSLRRPAAALTFLQTNPTLITNSVNDAKLVFGTSASNSNPIFQFDELSGRRDNAVANTIVDKMKSLADPRIAVYFKPIVNGTLAGQVLGNIPGDDTDDAGESLFSRTGSAYASTDSPVIFISAAEVNFIKAEIYFRASDVTNATLNYNNAITQDLTSLGLATSTVAYLANPLVTYNNTLQRIMEQKWITMYQGAYESFVDWRRTGFPALTPSVNNRTTNAIPVRLSYPQIEINVNNASLQAGPGIPLPYVSLSNKVWWDL